MGNDRTVILMDGDVSVGDVELICAFEVDDLDDKFIIYTKNERDSDGNTIIYSGKVKEINGKQYLYNIDEGFEWEKLKNIMRTMARYSLDGESYV